MQRSDEGVSDVVATILLLGVTVLVVGAAALQVGHVSPERGAGLSLDMMLFAQAGRSELTLLHGGGSELDAGELRAIVFVNDDVWYDGTPGPAGTKWYVGDRLSISPLQAAIPPDAHIAVTVAQRVVGVVLADAQTVATQPRSPTAATSPGFSVAVTLAGGASEIVLEPPAGLLVEATVAHPEGRKFVRFVYADFSGFDGVDWQELHDDGANGDRSAGDGVFTTVALVPTNTTSGVATVSVTATDFNGSRVSDSGSVQLLARGEVTEQAANPTSTPAPGGPPVCPSGNAAVRHFAFRINDDIVVPSLEGQVRQGDHVQAIVTIADGCVNIPLSLVTYTASAPHFTWENAQDQVLHDSQSVTASAGQVTLDVDVPACMFAIDLVRSSPRTSFGPPTSNNYYSRSGVLLDSDNGGTTTCSG